MTYESVRAAFESIARNIAQVGQIIECRRKQMQRRILSDIDSLEQEAADAQMRRLKVDFERLKDRGHDLDQLWRELRQLEDE